MAIAQHLSLSPRAFQQKIWRYYYANGRKLAWRDTRVPYKIAVSEVMLQQTQVQRVTRKYPEFLKAFPDFAALAAAPLSRVLNVWQGMGYNRRALSLQKLAQKVVGEYHGKLPRDPAVLETLPGIGPATARSIAAFAFSAPEVFIETNIRRVFIHFFFDNVKHAVNDKEILPLVEKTLDHKNPREWYFALMDYGAMLKTQVPNPNRRSAHYTKQAKFEGSLRQVRGMVLRELLAVAGRVSLVQLVCRLRVDQRQLRKALVQLQAEGFVVERKDFYTLIS